MTQNDNDNALILLAEVVGIHGIRGQVKLKCFSDDPTRLPSYQPMYTADGQETRGVTKIQKHNQTWIASLDGIDDRNAAELTRGLKLYIRRAQLPALDDDETFYHSDLIGMAAVLPDGSPLGTVIGINNFGASDLLDIKPATGDSFYVPFTDDCVGDIDIAAKRMTIDPPPGLLDDTPQDPTA